MEMMVQTQARQGVKLTRLNVLVSLLLIVFPALLLVVSSGGSTPYHIMAVVGLVCLAIRRPQLPRPLSADEKLARTGFYAFTLAVLISLVETGFSREAVKDLDVLLRPLWAILILYLFVRVNVSEALLWFGVALGAIVAGSSALYETLTVDSYVRANGATSAITFGNTALLMGLMAAVGAPYFQKLGRCYVVVPVLALLFGLMASLLSGSRGGWLALPALLMLLLWHFWREGYRRTSIVSAVLLLCFFAVAVALPQTGVIERAEEAVLTFNQYSEDPAQYGDTSVGQRLELWRASWNMFLEYPIFGGGIGHSFNAYLKEGVAEGLYHPSSVVQTMPHNVWLDTLAMQGLVGLAGLLGIWGALTVVFVRAVGRQQAESRMLGVAGLVLMVGYNLFGLTESVMGYGPPLVFFSLYSALIVYRIAQARLETTPSRQPG
ncbi:O-antigen ligase family protein [Marinobacter sp. CHS3-4]|uniref:O-antigen ligase family protein n=1 Tax=Marinobacter sp. CHS3-4 TaxID=3045174 RepID=UPI0024B612DD|nr:O-antigen ligase family protein [Marinobacter sp. CHS3-4]MDI9246698.1 O-antigen ligase family protein [Marinobacter sp. CHS3-4]